MTEDASLRFGGISRLVGSEGLARLASATVMVVGVGGVGSWTVEALARSAVGRLILVDLDEVCISNINRQLPALTDTVGQTKVSVLAERCRSIQPNIRVEECIEFFTEATEARLLGMKPDCIVDAIDSVRNKCRIISGCTSRGIPVVTCGAAGGRLDPTAIRRIDLSKTTHDRLLSEVRRRLRREHGFPRGAKRLGIEAISSTEPVVYPAGNGSICEVRQEVGGEGRGLRLNCDTGFGSATQVTGAFGFAAAASAIQILLQGLRKQVVR